MRGEVAAREMLLSRTVMFEPAHMLAARMSFRFSTTEWTLRGFLLIFSSSRSVGAKSD